eukprot:46074_1
MSKRKTRNSSKTDYSQTELDDKLYLDAKPIKRKQNQQLNSMQNKIDNKKVRVHTIQYKVILTSSSEEVEQDEYGQQKIAFDGDYSLCEQAINDDAIEIPYDFKINKATFKTRDMYLWYIVAMYRKGRELRQELLERGKPHKWKDLKNDGVDLFKTYGKKSNECLEIGYEISYC